MIPEDQKNITTQWCSFKFGSTFYVLLLQVSHIDCVSYEEAQDFVEDDTTHGWTRGMNILHHLLTVGNLQSYNTVQLFKWMKYMMKWVRWLKWLCLKLYDNLQGV